MAKVKIDKIKTTTPISQIEFILEKKDQEESSESD
jgi:hypothetical protein